MTVLITGATGFVGINLTRMLAVHGQRVVALTRRQPDEATLRFLGEYVANVQFIIGDVRDRAALVKLVRAESIVVIVHAAAVTPTPQQEERAPARVAEVNLGGTVNMLEAARMSDVSRVVFISSDGVYGSPRENLARIPETYLPVPVNLYSICKVAAEQMCLRYRDLFGFQVAIGRLGTAYGPMERATTSRHGMSTIQQLVQQATSGQQLRVFGAARRRDYCHIFDASEALARLVLADSLSWDVYNVGSGVASSLEEILEALGTVIPSVSWTEVGDPTDAGVAILPHQQRGALDISRLCKDVGFVPTFPLAVGVRACVDVDHSSSDHSADIHLAGQVVYPTRF